MKDFLVLSILLSLLRCFGHNITDAATVGIDASVLRQFYGKVKDASLPGYFYGKVKDATVPGQFYVKVRVATTRWQREDTLSKGFLLIHVTCIELLQKFLPCNIAILTLILTIRFQMFHFYIACFQNCNNCIRCLGFYVLNAASNAGKDTGCILCTWLLFRDGHNCCNTLSSGNIIYWAYFQFVFFLNYELECSPSGFLVEVDRKSWMNVDSGLPQQRYLQFHQQCQTIKCYRKPQESFSSFSQMLPSFLYIKQFHVPFEQLHGQSIPCF